MKIDIPNCKRFTGYKPCFPDHDCLKDGCKDNIPIGNKILIINLDAMGDVLMTTAQLPALKRKFPESTIYWITDKNAMKLLHGNNYIDFIYPYDAESISIFNNLQFDYIMNSDKSLRSCALLNALKSENKLGFGLNQDGKITPINQGSLYNYELGLNNELKFKINKKTGQDYLAETFELEDFYRRDEYIYNFNDDELEYINSYKKEMGLTANDFVVAFNTGCSNLYPNKKMTVQQHVYLINQLLDSTKTKIILLGGPEDAERNKEIHSYFKDKIINTPTNLGVRKGACFEQLADVVVTGDSFGMHLAIALKKYVIAWFGLSCWTEIDLYDRGVKLFQEDLFCSPCWKKVCPYNLECIQNIDLDRIILEVKNYYKIKIDRK